MRDFCLPDEMFRRLLVDRMLHFHCGRPLEEPENIEWKKDKEEERVLIDELMKVSCVNSSKDEIREQKQEITEK